MKTGFYRSVVLLGLLWLNAGMACKKTTGTDFRITEIRLDNLTLTLEAGKSHQLKATAVPAVANQPSYQWLSSNTAVATVSNGLVQAIAPGEAVITASSSGISSKAKITVTPVAVIRNVYDYSVLQITLKGADCPFADHADYGIYIPTRTEQLRGVVVLQHGCGMEQFGITKPYDLQYRAFARKWKLAVIETALYGNCGGWRSPESGSGPALLKVLQQTASATSHNELNTAPWLLWGHSGGGHWTLGMLRAYPERILAAVCYSPAFDPQWDYPAAVSKIPVLTRHAGKNDANNDGVLCQATSINAFKKLRDLDAPVSIVLNESQNHNLSYIRYMAIPFYEAALKQRLPETAGGVMKDIDRSKAWLGDTLTMQLYSAASYTGDKKGLCLFPDEASAKSWKEYYTTGTVTDQTPPPAPFNLKTTRQGEAVELTWSADADIESGIKYFEILRDGVVAGRLPESGNYQYFDLNGDNTLAPQVAPMRFINNNAASANAVFAVRTVNHFNLVSPKTEVQYTK